MGRAMGTSEISQIVSKIILGNRGDDIYTYIYILIYERSSFYEHVGEIYMYRVKILMRL